MKCPKCKKRSFDVDYKIICPQCGEKFTKTFYTIWEYVLGITLLSILYFIIHIVLIREHRYSNYNDGYKQGQIDALNNHWKYDRIIQEKVDTIYIKIKL